MSPKKTPTQPIQQPAQHKRFRIEKLEERVAPKKGGKGTNNCPATAVCFTVGCGGY